MKKHLARLDWTRQSIAFLTVCLATALGVLVGGAQVASASTCSTVLPYRVGYTTTSVLPAIGQTVSAEIKLETDHVYGGSVKGYVQVLFADGEYLRIGVRDQTGSGVQVFIGYNGGTVETFSAVKGQYYVVSITRNTSDTFTAKYNGNTLPVVISSSGGESDFFGEANNTTSTCNAMNYFFNTISPWTTNGPILTQFKTPAGETAYSVSTLGSVEFEVDGS